MGIEGVMKVPGGESRIESVKNALRTIDEEGTVFIHDAARPFVSPELIGRGASAIASGCGAVPVVPLADSIRHLTADGSESVPRSEYVAVQTPQVFRSEDIKAAYFNLENEEGLTDDASVAELYGIQINLFDGEPSNIKITTPADIDRFTDHR